MVKKATVIILLLLITLSSFSLDLRILNGGNWFSWSYDRKIGFVQGAICEGFKIVEMALLSNLVYNPSKLIDLRIDSDTIDREILNEISIFYNRTGKLDYPIYVVIYIRNIWKYQNYFPPWSESPWSIEGKNNGG